MYLSKPVRKCFCKKARSSEVSFKKLIKLLRDNCARSLKQIRSDKKLSEILKGILTGFVRLTANASGKNLLSDLSNKAQPRFLKVNRFGLLTVVVCFTKLTYAVEFEVVGPCDPKPRLDVSVNIKNEITLGDLTIELLNTNGIPYKGDAAGIAQIDDSPIGRDAIEVLSPTQYRAYGWCVHVDNFEPGEMPDKVQITPLTEKISWFYAYSLYDSGEWKDYCIPSWKVRSLNYCKSK